jgi:pyruvate dehydrogenase (quinone)
MMAETVADFHIERRMEWGVSRIYGYPGDGMNGITAALRKGGDGCDFVQVRHEEAAAFMASAHAKYSGAGSLGVCMATSGPGAIHLLNGLYDAKMAPPMPPHISFDQAKAITRALYRGDPAAEIIRHSFAALVEEYIPHR